MRPIVITGKTGTLGAAFARIAETRGLAMHLTDRAELDAADRCRVDEAIARHRPWLIVNTAGYVRVDDAERDVTRCRRDNTVAAEVLATACAHHGIGLVTFSSDLVFDGEKAAPYAEDDPPCPLGVYGRTKAEMEARVLAAHPGALVVRTSAFFGPWDEHNFLAVTLRELAAGRAVRCADDAVVSPTYVPDLVHACLDLAIDGEHGLWHLANRGATTWADLARAVARRRGAASARVVGVPLRSLGLVAPRPRYSALASRRAPLLPSLDDALGRYLDARRAA